MMQDTVTTIGNSLIQHGPNSNRVYLMKLDANDLPGLTSELELLTQKHGYTKIFAKVPAPHKELFLACEYECEGLIPGFYRGETDAVFLGKFLAPERYTRCDWDGINSIIAMALAKRAKPVADVPDGYRLRHADRDDGVALAELYGNVFASYPFPINNPAYVAETMQQHVRYFVAERDGVIVAAASCEMDPDSLNVEMTDFATRPTHCSKGLAANLLLFMEREMRRLGMRTLYTIARAISPGMNIAFARCGYSYGGTLVNNTQIAGSIESMNLWHRDIDAN